MKDSRTIRRIEALEDAVGATPGANSLHIRLCTQGPNGEVIPRPGQGEPLPGQPVLDIVLVQGPE